MSRISPSRDGGIFMFAANFIFPASSKIHLHPEHRVDDQDLHLRFVFCHAYILGAALLLGFACRSFVQLRLYRRSLPRIEIRQSAGDPRHLDEPGHHRLGPVLRRRRADVRQSQRRRLTMFGVVSGPLLWMFAFLFIPYAVMFTYSFYSRQFPAIIPDFQIGNYITLVTDPQYYQVLLRTLEDRRPGVAGRAGDRLSADLLPGVPNQVGAPALGALHRRHRAALGFLPAARLYLEDDPRQRGRVQLVPDLDRHHRRAGETSSSTASSPWSSC